jgi:ATP-dependent protease Clp ATPase subunit
MAKGLWARGLQGSLEEVLIDAQFQAPSLPIKPKQFILDAHVMVTKIPKWVYWQPI